jgi:excinuclease ABC subunit C
MNDALAAKLARLPTGPGVYQHKDAEGTVIYVGKAKNLRSRVRSYFQESRPRDRRLTALVSRIADLEIIVTDTEAEALILENNLIKKLKPRYNVNLKDDKTYPWIVVTSERFPRVFPTRRVVRDGSKYFGPYTDVKAMYAVLEAVRSLFKLRTCSLHLAPEPIAAGKFQACLEYHIQRCAAPCIGLQSEEDYGETIRRIEKLLNGQTQELAGLIKEDMQRLAAAFRFEDAAARRDQLKALEKYAEKQKVISPDLADRDLFALCLDRESDVAVGVLFKVREGKVIGRHHRVIRRIEGLTEAEIMQALVEQHYTEASFFPNEVLLSHAPEDAGVIEAFLRESRGRKVELKVPERGDKAGLMRMAELNCELILTEWKQQRDKAGEGHIPKSVPALQKDLRLPVLPRRIECFDISHLAGTGTVASCVVFEDGMPRKSEYRHYKVRTLESGQIDDFASMREIVARRYTKVREENGPWPDLVIIDGGKGQLSSAVEALKAAEVYGKFPVVGLAKRLEELFFPGDTESILIPRTSASLHLVQRVRNEAHRFAVTFQRKQRQLTTLQTALTDIPGVGAATAQKLMKAFGSVKRIQLASEEAIAEVAGKAAARRVVQHYRGLRTEEQPPEHALQPTKEG